MKNVITVTKACIRLDQYLTKKLTQYSRSFLKQQIKQGNVLVNGKIKKPSYILKVDDKVKIKIVQPKKPALQPNPNIKLTIIYEDDNIIILDKPAGISTHPARTEQHDTIVSGLLSYYPAIKNVGDAPEIRPGIVHRLDKDTSGLMVVAKNQKAFDWLKKQFIERRIVKKYLALVVGKTKEKKGIISKAIGRAKHFGKRTIIPYKQQKEATTTFKVIKYFSGYSLVEAEPETGRTHQIRVHFASIGHPIADDKLYGFKRQLQPKELNRQFLHASYLKFTLPDGKMVEFKSKLPSDLEKCLQKLRLSIRNN